MVFINPLINASPSRDLYCSYVLCRLLDVKKNTIKNNDVTGIYFGNVSNGIIQENIINNHRGDGISLSYSSDNIITKNYIYDNDYCGIIISYYSHYNNLTYNTLQNNQYCISIGTSCQGTYLSYNDPCEIWNHTDITEFEPEPDPDPPEDNSTDNEDNSIYNSEEISGYNIFLLSSSIITYVLIITYIKKRGGIK